MTPRTWTEEVGRFTEDHRRARADALRDRALERYLEVRRGGGSPTAARASADWHLRRARAQSRRIEAVLDCGAESLCIECQACGRKAERRTDCRVRLLCVSCRSACASQRRARFLQAREVLVARAAERGLLNPRRRGGRWSEKFLTLTVPHVESDSIAARILRVLDAWPHFLKRFNAYTRGIAASTTTQWLRVVEWTPGTDGGGHPHLHVWLFCPFVDIKQVRDWWRWSLTDDGVLTATPIVHIEEIHDPNRAAQELIKYLTKDIDADGVKIAPDLYAQVYEALDERRQVQGSRGFMALATREHTCECGASLPKRVRRVRSKSAESTGTSPEEDCAAGSVASEKAPG